jgi:hypothetical protein
VKQSGWSAATSLTNHARKRRGKERTFKFLR